jgi:hypothetical protein
MLRIVENWDPFPGEDPSKNIIYERYSNPDCTNEIIIEDYLFKRNIPYIRPVNERFTAEDLKRMHDYSSVMSSLERGREERARHHKVLPISVPAAA